MRCLSVFSFILFFTLMTSIYNGCAEFKGAKTSNLGQSSETPDPDPNPPSNSTGKIYYVCGSGSACGAGWATGDDTNSLTEAQNKLSPWKTIDYAEETVKAGDMIIVGSGIYNTHSAEYSDTVLYIQNTGKPGLPITIKSEKKWGAIIDGSGLHSGVWFDCDEIQPLLHSS